MEVSDTVERYIWPKNTRLKPIPGTVTRELVDEALKLKLFKSAKVLLWLFVINPQELIFYHKLKYNYSVWVPDIERTRFLLRKAGLPLTIEKLFIGGEPAYKLSLVELPPEGPV